MAEIIVNGNTQIIPNIIPEQILAKRGLDAILPELERLYADFKGIDPLEDTDIIRDMISRSKELKKRYKRVLEHCSSAIEHSDDSEERKKALHPLMIFLFRSADNHSVTPFAKYLYKFSSEFNFDYYRSESFREFVDARLVESVRNCEAYVTLVSQTLNTKIQPVNIKDITEEAFNIAYRKTMHNSRYSGFYSLMGFHKKIFSESPELKNQDELIEKHPLMVKHLETVSARNEVIRKQFEKSKILVEVDDTIQSIPELLSFYLINTLGNHFKAAHELFYFYEEVSEDPDESGNLNKEKYQKLTLPEVHINIEPYGAHHIAIISRDNGLGMSRKKLENLFNPNYREGDIGYAAHIDGNGSTLFTYPLVCDFLGATLVVSSEGEYNGSTFKLILPKDLENPQELPTNI